MLGLSIVILSYNRREALAHTLREIFAQPWAKGAQIIVVDNASADGSAEMVRREFPGAELIALDRNTVIEGFNIGAQRARHEVLLILDDDSWPQPGSVEAALEHLERHPGVAGVMLHRRHPRTQRPEWPFDQPDLTDLQTGWPDMGCGNMIRRAAWTRVGGYEVGYFLYRNDTDLALKLQGAGHDVVFHPRWQVWHDSPVVVRKSNRWLRLSTRNWVWMSKRHGRGVSRVVGVLLGWLHAHRLAGLRPAGQLCVLWGALAGVFRPSPPLPAGVKPDGAAYARLLKLKMRWR